MAKAVSLWFDDALEARIRSMWAELAQHRISSALHDGPYRPHVTLGVWEQLDLEVFVPAASRLARDLEPFPITFDSVGTFPGTPAVVFLRPGSSGALRSVHERIHARVGESGTGPSPLYAPGRWQPHCTLAWQLDREGLRRACDLLRGSPLPGAGTVAAIGVIDTPAEIERHRLPLGKLPSFPRSGPL